MLLSYIFCISIFFLFSFSFSFSFSFLNYSFAFDESFLFLEEPTILSGSYLPTKLTKAPFAITIIEEKDLKYSGFDEIFEILRFQPGIIYFQSNPSEVSLGMRGTSQFLSNTILVLLNGKPIYDDFFGNNFWSFLPITIDDIERIEIIRGPESVIYGANAFSGVINLITKKDIRNAKFQFSSRIGTPYRHLYHLSFSPDSKNIYLSSSWDEVGDFENHRHRSRRLRKFFGHYESNISSRDSLSLSIGLSDGDYDFKPFGLRLANRDGYQFITNFSYQKYPYTVEFSWQKIEAKCPGGTKHYLDFLRNQLQSKLLDSPKNQLIFGLGFDYYRLDAKLMGGKHEHFLYHFFLEDHLKIFGKYLLISAFRFDHHPITGDHFIPKVSFIYYFKPGHSLRFAWGKAFKNPSLFQAYKQFCFGKICHFGDTSIDSEKISVFELAYRGYFNPRLFLSFSAFYQIYDDILFSHVFSAKNKVMIYPKNNGRMYQYGSELEFSWEIFEEFKAHFNYSYLHLDKQKEVVWGPLSSHQVNLGFQFIYHNFSLNFLYHWQSAGFYTYQSHPTHQIKLDNIPSYDYASLNMVYRKKNFLLSFLVKNLFNNNHRECAYCEKIGTYFGSHFSFRF